MSAASFRPLAEAVLAASVEAAGLIAITDASPRGRAPILDALRKFAGSRLQLVDVSRSTAGETGALSGMMPPVEGPGAASEAPPLVFVITDAGRDPTEKLRATFDTPPFSRAWAAMLSLRIVLITSLSRPELDFIEDRITACFSGAEPAPPPKRESAAAGRIRQKIARTMPAARMTGTRRGKSAIGSRRSATKAGKRRTATFDPRPFFFVGVVVIAFALIGLFLMSETMGPLPSRTAPGSPPARAAGAVPALAAQARHDAPGIVDLIEAASDRRTAASVENDAARAFSELYRAGTIALAVLPSGIPNGGPAAEPQPDRQRFAEAGHGRALRGGVKAENPRPSPVLRSAFDLRRSAQADPDQRGMLEIPKDLVLNTTSNLADAPPLHVRLKP